ncbi:hypothetical protein COO60DRAFT_1139840 [Scenedesmus sp. NREL 46B-D3]|nr:hypothetical protein COO60DRAFT_1139840 [Scenedesmus sp. NREL 46B-D3]
MHCFRRSSLGAAGSQQSRQSYTAGSSSCNPLFRAIARHGCRPALTAAAAGGDAAAATPALHRPAGPLLLDTIRKSFKTRSPAPASKKARGSPHICVLGAGVNGLATALRLQQALPAARITVYADKFGSDLTSHGAAGVWQPYKLSETPEVLTHRWGADTFTHLMGLVHSPEAAQAGVQPMHCHCLFLAEEPEPFWAATVQGFQRMRGQELDLFSQHVDWPSIQASAAAAAAAAASTAGATGSGGPGDGSIDSYTAAQSATAFVDGYTFNTVVCEGRLYMRWLGAQLDAAGVTQQQRRIGSLAELAGEGWDLVVNCCGLGARELLPDPHCYPIRGQVMRVRAPWVTQCVFAEFPDGTSYIIPNREWVVLGGTGQVGDHNTAMSLGDAEMIADRALQVVPSLRQAEVLDHWVGLRPGR